MTLLCTLFAAIISTILWYTNPAANKMKIGTLALMYWGASLMWTVDAIFEYKASVSSFFHPGITDLINDTYLGLSVIALGLIIWLVIVLIKDPFHVVKKHLFKQTSK